MDTPADMDVGSAMADMAMALGDEVEVHIELAKAELARDARSLGQALAPLVVGGGLVGLAHVFTSVAAALALGPHLGEAGGLALVGALNLLLGAAVLRWSLRRVGVPWGAGHAS